MGVKDFWITALGGFKAKKHQDLSDLRGKKIAFNALIVLNRCNGRAITQLATTNVPVYASPEILENIQEFHRCVLAAGITPCYVHDGVAPPIKRLEKERCKRDRDKHGEEYDEFLANVLQLEQEGGEVAISDSDLE